VTYQDDRLADLVEGRLRDLLTSIRQANLKRLYVKIDIGVDDAWLDIWRNRDGRVDMLDKDRAREVRSTRIWRFPT